MAPHILLNVTVWQERWQEVWAPQAEPVQITRLIQRNFLKSWGATIQNTNESKTSSTLETHDRWPAEGACNDLWTEGAQRLTVNSLRGATEQVTCGANQGDADNHAGVKLYNEGTLINIG